MKGQPETARYGRLTALDTRRLNSLRPSVPRTAHTRHRPLSRRARMAPGELEPRAPSAPMSPPERFGSAPPERFGSAITAPQTCLCTMHLAHLAACSDQRATRMAQERGKLSVPSGISGPNDPLSGWHLCAVVRTLPCRCECCESAQEIRVRARLLTHF